jgi:hypothetical protein
VNVPIFLGTAPRAHPTPKSPVSGGLYSLEKDPPLRLPEQIREYGGELRHLSHSSPPRFFIVGCAFAWLVSRVFTDVATSRLRAAGASRKWMNY